MKKLMGRRASLGALAGLAAAPLLASKASAKPAKPMPPVTIYHLEGRRSERIVWLMEELGLPYDLKFKRGDLAGSMAMIREFSPVVPMAPTVKYGDQVLVESGAIIELILNRHAPGKLQPALESRDYPDYLMWMHFAEGSLAARLFSDYRAWMAQPPKARSRLVDSEAVVQFAEDFLGKHPWFGGPAFSGADIMMMFPLNAATGLNLVEASQFPNVAAWKARIEARPAYQRMLAKARPDGMIGNLPRLPQHAPAGPRPAPAPQN
jgi:glutathione S-transferase